MKTKCTLRRAAARVIRSYWADEAGQDIAEYAVLLAVILIITVGTLRLVGSNTNLMFSNVASEIH